MTVISTVITRWCTAHASDSLLTERQASGKQVPKEWEKTKIIPVRRWRGAMAYWGLAACDAYAWSTYDWLRKQAGQAGQFSSAEEFAQKLAESLSKELSKMRFSKPTDSGIGVHLTAYEYIDNYWIPELFLLTNFDNSDKGYTSVFADGVHVTRETFRTLAKEAPKPEHREAPFRHRVREYLQQQGKMFFFNNGDPIMFNAAAGAILKMIRALAERGKLAGIEEVKTHLAIARRPIEIVARVQHDFCLQGDRFVGGKPHDLAVTPTGEYHSKTGDAKGV